LVTAAGAIDNADAGAGAGASLAIADKAVGDLSQIWLKTGNNDASQPWGDAEISIRVCRFEMHAPQALYE
jgi:hypothetical protein